MKPETPQGRELRAATKVKRAATPEAAAGETPATPAKAKPEAAPGADAEIAAAPDRCPWCLSDPAYIRYHDEEWGRPVHDDRKIFEFLILESAQAGLSWLTILRKREGYRQAFAGFDPQKVARFTEKDVERLLQDPGIIRNRQKIAAAIGNAGIFLDIQREYGSFSDYIWGFLPGGKPIVNHWEDHRQAPARTELSDRISADLKRRGFKFFGTTICYAHMQATGMVNDHILSCRARQA